MSLPVPIARACSRARSRACPRARSRPSGRPGGPRRVLLVAQTALGLVLLATGCSAHVAPPGAPPAPALAAEPGGTAADGELLGRRPQARALLIRAGLDPDAIRCNTRVSFDTRLDRHARAIVDGLATQWQVELDPARRERAVHHALGYLVRSYFDQVRPHNAGVLALKGRSWQDAAGRSRPLLVFRSGVTIDEAVPPGPSRCFESLLGAGQVRHVVNLYGGTFPLHDVVAAEKRRAGALKASCVDLAAQEQLKFRGLVEHAASYERNKAEAMRRLATLIRTHLLQPAGAPPRGNLYVHCGGGMHRTGIVIGVLRRCINADPLATIEAEYRRHVAFVSARAPGGFEELNLRFIREFDCSLLRGRPAAAVER